MLRALALLATMIIAMPIAAVAGLVMSRIPPQPTIPFYVKPLQLAPTVEWVKPTQFEPTARDETVKGDRLDKRRFDPSIFAGCDPFEAYPESGEVCGRGKG